MITSKLLGFDCFHGDGLIQFGKAKQAGNQFVFCKATEGVAVVDPQYHYNRSHAVMGGLLVGSYHFFTADDAIEQAKHFLSVAFPQKGELVPVLDIETYFDGCAQAAHSAASYIKQATGRWPIIYSGRAFYEEYLASTFPADLFTLWLAEYGPQPSISPLAFWQYSQSGTLAGHNGNVDLNYFMGTIDELKKHCF